MIRVAQVVPSVENRASGPSYSVVALCRVLAARGCRTSLYVLDGLPPGLPAGIEAHRFDRWPFPRRLGVSPAMRAALFKAVPELDILHGHSLWMMPNLYPAQAARGRACKLVVSPRGTLSAWALARSAWRKRLIWRFGQKAALERADCFHATAPEEAEDIRRLGFNRPVAVIPNGIDVPELKALKRGAPPFTLLFAGRIHPKKGIAVLLKAWAALAPEFPEWRVRIVGPDNEGHLAELREQVRRDGCRDVAFDGPLFGEALEAAYQGADLYALPTFSENFGMTVAEALANGAPVVVTRGAPWSGVETQRCGWWIGQGVEPLVGALREAFRLPSEERAAMGLRGRAWMAREFGWERVGERMLAVYEWLVNGGQRPDWVER